jgi:hypothetical protein
MYINNRVVELEKIMLHKNENIITGRGIKEFFKDIKGAAGRLFHIVEKKMNLYWKI